MRSYRPTEHGKVSKVNFSTHSKWGGKGTRARRTPRSAEADPHRYTASSPPPRPAPGRATERGGRGGLHVPTPADGQAPPADRRTRPSPRLRSTWLAASAAAPPLRVSGSREVVDRGDTLAALARGGECYRHGRACGAAEAWRRGGSGGADARRLTRRTVFGDGVCHRLNKLPVGKGLVEHLRGGAPTIKAAVSR